MGEEADSIQIYRKMMVIVLETSKAEEVRLIITIRVKIDILYNVVKKNLSD